MKRILQLNPACLALILFISGCASIKFIDTVPSGSPKGYVEFYYLKSKGSSEPTRSAVYTFFNDRDKTVEENTSFFNGRDKILEGYTSFWDLKNKVGLRLAKIPGNYTFLVHSQAGLDSTIVIQIKEGMISPVKIAFASRWMSEGNGAWEKEVLYLDLIPDKEILYSEYLTKKERPADSNLHTTRVAPIPPWTPKGYVEFYFPQGKVPDYTPSIYSLVDNQEVYEGYPSLYMENNRFGLRCERIPGTHEFSIHVVMHRNYTSSYYRFKLPVKIEANMITPVKITFPDSYNGKPGTWYVVTSDPNTMNGIVEVEKTIPYVKSEGY